MSSLPALESVLASLLLSAGLTALVARAARRLRLVDPLEDRRLHTEVTPRGGGLGIALVLAAGLVLWSPSIHVGGLLVGLLVTAGVGLVDDFRPLLPAVKAAAQGLGALLAALALPLPLTSPLLGVLLATVLVLATVNIWNFMDGSNGMAAGQTLVIATALAGWGGGELMWVFAAACAGFLPFNLVRARVFLGDVGSHALGFGIAIGLLAGVAAGQVRPYQAAMLVSAFWLDAGWTLALRIARREPFWQAHSQHLYQRAIRRGHSHLRLCLGYAAWTVGAALLARCMGGSSERLQLLTLLALWALGSAIYFGLLRRWQPSPNAGAGSPDL